MGGLSSPWNFLSDLPPLHLSWNRRSRERLQEREGWGQCWAAGVWLLHPRGSPTPCQQTPAKTCWSPWQGSQLVNDSLDGITEGGEKRCHSPGFRPKPTRKGWWSRDNVPPPPANSAGPAPAHCTSPSEAARAIAGGCTLSSYLQ